ncbi:MAG: DNA repair protein RadA [Alphaproteobacteria bacterium MarineAlpha2_Bin1]|nr:MAG: DNA repair protein RadA [Alphaproteobacteria bacterium MarineAlpha2_Bin1]
MKKNKTIQYTCNLCGSIHSKWVGKCDNCESWNTLYEENNNFSSLNDKNSKVIELNSLKQTKSTKKRILTNIREFDQVCGGGLVPGSVILLGGDPGIGKSTLLLQVLAKIVDDKYKCIYVSGEESVQQIKIRSDRIGVSEKTISLFSSTDVGSIIKTVKKNNNIDILAIDSIQTMFLNTLESAPGTISQVRSSAQELIKITKNLDINLILVSHVTKDGQIAGPRVLEHMVDTVLYFEGENSNDYRVLRSIKNRFGPTDEIGIFEMTSLGLHEVINASQIFLPNHGTQINGNAIYAGIEGTRPILLEIQALVASTSHSNPRRSVIGWDNNRLSMILAILEKSCGISLGNKDVYLNVVGGLKIKETAADLAVASAILSSYFAKPLPNKSLIFGELGLSGEVRPIKQMIKRLNEGKKQGFKNAYMPPSNFENKNNIAVNKINKVSQLIEVFNFTRNA